MKRLFGVRAVKSAEALLDMGEHKSAKPSRRTRSSFPIARVVAPWWRRALALLPAARITVREAVVGDDGYTRYFRIDPKRRDFTGWVERDSSRPSAGS